MCHRKIFHFPFSTPEHQIMPVNSRVLFIINWILNITECQPRERIPETPPQWICLANWLYWILSIEFIYMFPSVTLSGKCACRQTFKLGKVLTSSINPQYYIERGSLGTSFPCSFIQKVEHHQMVKLHWSFNSLSSDPRKTTFILLCAKKKKRHAHIARKRRRAGFGCHWVRYWWLENKMCWVALRWFSLSAKINADIWRAFFLPFTIFTHGEGLCNSGKKIPVH